MKVSQEIASFGPVHLTVTDGKQSTRFWQDVVGLSLLKSGATLEFGSVNKTLIVLHPTASSKFKNGYSGLYHLAIHLSNAGDFARILFKLINSGWPISPTDHVMSKSIYLEDPDGITIEFTLETPERLGKFNLESGRFEVIDAQGHRRSATAPLDVEEALSALPNNANSGIFDEAKIGHVHLYVGDLRAAFSYYKKLGFIENLFAENFGLADLSAGGQFKHRIAMNTWQGLGVPQAPQGTAGMEYFIINFDSKVRLQKAVASLTNPQKIDSGYLTHDPSGNALVLTV